LEERRKKKEAEHKKGFLNLRRTNRGTKEEERMREKSSHLVSVLLGEGGTAKWEGSCGEGEGTEELRAES